MSLDYFRIQRPTVLITGASGLLGSDLVPILKNSNYNVITHAKSKRADYSCDLSIKEHSFYLYDNVDPDIIINLVGLTSVELCEQSPNLAYKVNTRVVENIVEWISSKRPNCFLIHISTDQVYDSSILNLEDEISLTNMYAFSKYAAEISASKVSSTILRTNFFGRSKVLGRESITDWVYSNLINGKEIKVFNDVYFSPLSIKSICKFMLIIIEKRISGIYNFGSNNGMTKADFDFFFAEKLGLQMDTMVRINSENFKNLKAYRPKDMRMNNSKFQSTFNIQLPSLEDEILKVVSEYIVP